MLDFNQRVAIVTGAGQGMGNAHAVMLAERGARVVVNDVSVERAEAVVDEIVNAGGTAVSDTHDVSQEAAAAVGTALDAYAGRALACRRRTPASGGPRGAWHRGRRPATAVPRPRSDASQWWRSAPTARPRAATGSGRSIWTIAPRCCCDVTSDSRSTIDMQPGLPGRISGSSSSIRMAAGYIRTGSANASGA